MHFIDPNKKISLISKGIPKDDSIHEPSIQARQHRGGLSPIGRHNFPHDMSSMEIGMYVLLTVFCFAILVFVVACVVYASKFRPISIDNDKDRTNSLRILRGPKKISESTTNAHDWVWLGRSTMDRSSMIQDGNGNAHVLNNQRGIHTIQHMERNVNLTNSHGFFAFQTLEFV